MFSVLMLSLMYLAASLVPALHAEGQNDQLAYVSKMASVLEIVGDVAQRLCAAAVFLYMAAALHVIALHLGGNGDTPSAGAMSRVWSGIVGGPLNQGRGQLLTMHAVCLICAEIKMRTVEAMGRKLPQCLLGKQRAKKLTIPELVKAHHRRIFLAVMNLRECAPENKMLVAVLVALRRFAAFLFLLLAMLVQSAEALGPILSFFSAMALVAWWQPPRRWR